MAYGRSDITVQDAQGNALSGASVYWLTQPSDTTVTPPAPLAALYTDSTGATSATNPQTTDGFGHAATYLAVGQNYTIAVYHQIFGSAPMVYVDQAVEDGAIAYSTFAGVPNGTIDGSNKSFAITNNGTIIAQTPKLLIATLNGVQQVVSLSGNVITYPFAPQPASSSAPADTIYAQGLY